MLPFPDGREVEPNPVADAVRKAGVQRVLTELLDWVNEEYARERELYIHILKKDLEITLMRYKERYIYEDNK